MVCELLGLDFEVGWSGSDVTIGATEALSLARNANGPKSDRLMLPVDVLAREGALQKTVITPFRCMAPNAAQYGACWFRTKRERERERKRKKKEERERERERRRK